MRDAKDFLVLLSRYFSCVPPRGTQEGVGLWVSGTPRMPNAHPTPVAFLRERRVNIHYPLSLGRRRATRRLKRPVIRALSD